MLKKVEKPERQVCEASNEPGLCYVSYWPFFNLILFIALNVVCDTDIAMIDVKLLEDLE